MLPHPNYKYLLLFNCLIFLTELTGCNNLNSLQLDSMFGYSVRAAREAQISNPGNSHSAETRFGLDGNAGVSAIERYQDTFKTPPRTFEVINIGGATAGP